MTRPGLGLTLNGLEYYGAYADYIGMQEVEHIERFERATAPGKARSWASLLSIVMLAGLGLAYVSFTEPPSSALAGPVSWEMRLSAGLAESARSRKPVFARFTAEWCGPCREMDRNVYSKPATAERLNRFTVPTLIDLTTPSDATNALSLEYKVQFVPTALLLDQDGKVISRLEGGVDHDTFVHWLALNGI